MCRRALEGHESAWGPEHTSNVSKSGRSLWSLDRIEKADRRLVRPYRFVFGHLFGLILYWVSRSSLAAIVRAVGGLLMFWGPHFASRGQLIIVQAV